MALIPPTAQRVLDIGCGAGALGALLKQRQPAEVVGMELQPEAAAQARRRLDQVFEQNAEDPAVEFPAGSFDCVVCADVLEHLREPAQVLAKIRRWLAPGGCLVASIPNVRHHSVVASLMAGNWTYESAGLLDSDHVRFFTRREIEKLLYRQGFAIETLQSVLGPGDDERIQAAGSGEVQIGSLSLCGLTADDVQEFFTYQYLLVAHPALSPLASGAWREPAVSHTNQARPDSLADPAEGGQEPRGSHDERIARFVRDYPWPAEKPNVPIPTEKLGWFKEPQRELMRSELNGTTKLVVELGAWLGLSTRFIADQEPQARVISIDHWQGSAEHRQDPVCAAMLPKLFEIFTAMNWEYRDQVTPLKMTTREGLQTIAAYGLEPDVIFIDAEHTYEAVCADLDLARELFPQARLIGDDYDSPDVQRAVEEFAERHGLQVQPVGKGWRAWRFVAPDPLPTAPPAETGLTSIIIVTHNQCAYTKECVDSIRLRTDEPYELIFVDNGSTDRTVEYLRSLSQRVAGTLRVPSAKLVPAPHSIMSASPETLPSPLAGEGLGAQSQSTTQPARGLQSVRVIENPDNRGFPAAVNQGLKIARGDYIVLLNNDTVVNGDLMRVEKDSSSGTMKLIYDGQNILLQTDGSDLTQASYTLEPKEFGNLIAQRQNQSGTWVPIYYAFDGLGSTDSLTDGSQVITDTYTYFAFGVIKNTTGSTTNLFTWVGQLGYVRDVETGEMQAHVRQIQPLFGRMKSPDPLGMEPDVNPYRIVKNDPVNRTDPSGLEEEHDATKIVVNDVPYYISEYPLFRKPANLSKEDAEASIVIHAEGIDEDAKAVLLSLALQGAVYRSGRDEAAFILDQFRTPYDRGPVGDAISKLYSGGRRLLGIREGRLSQEAVEAFEDATHVYAECKRALEETESLFKQLKFDTLRLSGTVWGAGVPAALVSGTGFGTAMDLATPRILTRYERNQSEGLEPTEIETFIPKMMIPIPFLGRALGFIGRGTGTAAKFAANFTARRLPASVARVGEAVLKAVIAGAGRAGTVAVKSKQFAINSVRQTTLKLLDIMKAAGRRGWEWFVKKIAPTDRGAWALKDVLERGIILERKLGKNTPDQFPYYDEWLPNLGRATSIKTTDVTRPISSVKADLRQMARKAADLPLSLQKKGFIERDGLLVRLSDIKTRGLRVGIEPGKSTPEIKAMFESIKEYGKELGLQFVEFIEVK